MNFLKKILTSKIILLGILIVWGFSVPHNSFAQDVDVPLTEEEIAAYSDANWLQAQELSEREDYVNAGYLLVTDAETVRTNPAATSDSLDLHNRRMQLLISEYDKNYPPGGGIFQSSGTNAFSRNQLLGNQRRLQQIANDLYHRNTPGGTNPPYNLGQIDQRIVQASNAVVAPDDLTKCDPFWHPSTIGYCIGEVISFVGNWVLIPLFGTILSSIALLFDYAISWSVTDFARTIGDLGSIKLAWVVLRDLANIFFIFLILYLAIGTALQLDNVSVKKMLPRIIIVALLINFSMFFTRIVIDASNLLAYQFYKGINLEDTRDISIGEVTIGRRAKTVSGAIISGLDLNAQFSTKDPKTGVVRELPKGMFDSIAAVAGSLFVVVVASFVVLAGAIMLIIRIVSLIFFLVLSPLAFLAAAFPGQKGQFDKWFKGLINQCFFAPFYLMFLFVSIKIIKGGLGTTVGLGAKWGGAVSLQYFIIIGMLLASLILATKMGAFGAQKAIGWAGKINRGAFKGGLWASKKMGLGTLKYGAGAITSATGVIAQTTARGTARYNTGTDWRLKGKKLRESGVKEVKKFGTETKGTIKKQIKESGSQIFNKKEPIWSPLKAASENLATISGEALGFKSGILGPTRDEERESKKKEKEEKEEKKKVEMKENTERLKAIPDSTPATPNDSEQAKIIYGTKDKDISEIDVDALIKHAQFISASQLSKGMEGWAKDKRKKIKEKIMAAVGATPTPIGGWTAPTMGTHDQRETYDWLVNNPIGRTF